MPGIILTVAYVIIFLFIISRMKLFKTAVDVKYLQGVFLLKVVAGIALGLIYTFYYTNRKEADIFKYFDDSKILFDSLFTKPHDFIRMLTGWHSDDADLQNYYETMTSWNNSDNIYNDNRNLIRLNTLLRFISGGSYYAHAVFMCFISLCGLTGLYRVFIAEVKNKNLEIFFAVFLLPSVIFWNSGMLKDGLMIFAFGILLWNFYLMLHNGITRKRILVFLLTALWLTILKLYILMIALPGLLLLLYYGKIAKQQRHVFFVFTFAYIVYFALIFNLKYIFPNYDFAWMIYKKQFNFLNLLTIIKSGSAIDIPVLEPTVWSIVKNIPQAFCTILLRPYLWEAKSVFILIAAVENVVIVAAIILCVLSINLQQQINKPFFWFSFYFVFILFALIGLVTPVMGAFVRYKVPALPFLMLLLIMLYDRNKLFGIFYKRKR